MTRGFESVMWIALLGIAVSASAAYGQAPSPRPPVVRDLASELACAPTAVEALPSRALHVVGGQVAGRTVFGPGDALVVNGGPSLGLKAGQLYFVRRVVSDPFRRWVRHGVQRHQIHTAGWIRIDDVHADAAVATVTRACDAVMPGDYLEPFELPAVPSDTAPGQVDFAAPGRLIFGDEWRELGGVGSYMVLDRGAVHGVHPGQHVTIFRPAGPAGRQAGVIRVGEATAMLVGAETTTVRVDKSADVIYVGDLGAINR
jgi:hypothetical protein